ncbi:major facilitator superfamily domain-containing protein [Xylariales sp. PMI_506]|nr:major facilitator superfamily domain-containing protein [Xylariales sp. PMI_506]
MESRTPELQKEERSGSDSDISTLDVQQDAFSSEEIDEKAITPQPIPQPTPQNDAPDGGIKAWSVVFGAWCVSFCSFGWLNSVGVFQEYYAAGPLREYSDSTIAWIPSLQIFFMMAGGPIIGRIYDRFGPRWLIIGGTFLHVFGLMMASLSTEYYQFLLSQGVCSAIGVSAIFQPALNTIVSWFNKKRGLAYGLLATGSSLGGIVFPVMLIRLINTIGYPWAIRTAAFLILALLSVAIATVRSRHAPQKSDFTVKHFVQPFRERTFLPLLIGFTLVAFGIWIPITYIPTEAVDHGGVNEDLAQYLIALLNAGSLFGRLSAGIAADKIGNYNTFGSACYVTSILGLAMWIPSSTQSTVIAYAVLFGFFSGAYVSLIGAVVAQISPPREIGFRTGLVFLVSAVPALTTGPIAGAILANTGSWTNVKVFSSIFIFAGTTMLLLTKVAHVGWKPWAKF